MKIHVCGEVPCPIEEQEHIDQLNAGSSVVYTKDDKPMTPSSKSVSDRVCKECGLKKCDDFAKGFDCGASCCPCQPQQEYHHPDYCKTCKADIGITGVCAVHGQNQPQQERREDWEEDMRSFLRRIFYVLCGENYLPVAQIEGIMAKVSVLKKKGEEAARADERKKTFESVIALVESEGKCYCGLAETIHTDGCAENRAVIKRLSNAIDRLSKDL